MLILFLTLGNFFSNLYSLFCVVFKACKLQQVPPRPWLDSGEGGPYYGSSFNILRAHPDYSTINVNYEMKKRLKSR